nr:disease resistance protein RPV1-like [Ziziphus jujuba var. spinosa]
MANSVATTSLLANAPGTQHDVFLSFRGSDIRSNFKGHLYKALDQKGIHTFVDENLDKGTEISPTLITAIRKSKISIIIFSKHYAYSPWCLDELVEILKCRESFRQLVWPVFFYVNPSEVRNHRGNFGIALAKYKGSSKIKYKEKLPNWKATLTKASNLAGWHLSKGYVHFLMLFSNIFTT